MCILHYNNNANHGNFTREKLEKEKLDIVISSFENKTRDRVILSWRKLLYCDKGTNSLKRHDYFKGQPDRYEIGAVVTSCYGRWLTGEEDKATRTCRWEDSFWMWEGPATDGMKRKKKREWWFYSQLPTCGGKVTSNSCQQTLPTMVEYAL